MRGFSKRLIQRFTSFFLVLLTCFSLIGCADASGWMTARATDTDPELDFSSCRLVLSTDEEDVIRSDDTILGSYGSIHLLSFDSETETEEAYSYYKEQAISVEPDAFVMSAEEPAEEPEAISMDETDNPVAVLNDMEISEDLQEEQEVIALIDTGASEQANIIDRISVIDDQLEGENQHGNDMVTAIVSQDPNAKILSIRAMNDQGYGTISSLVAAMEYAIEQDVDLINLSLYAKTTLSNSVLKEEILKATDAGILVIGAAGNDSADVADYMPGSVEEAHIIGAADEDGSRQKTSNYGDTVDYNVVAKTTSEATALFTGYVSANGIDAVTGVLNQGLIYTTDFASEQPDTGDSSEEVPEEPSKETSAIDLRIVGTGSFIYSDNASDPKTVDDELVIDTTEADIDAVLTLNQKSWIFVQDEASNFVGTYSELESGNTYDLKLAKGTDRMIWIICDESTAQEWISGSEEDIPFEIAYSSTVTSYQQISDGLTACGKFTVKDSSGTDHYAFCTDHYAATPPAGTSVSVSEYTNAALAKVLYYGYGGPGTILGTSDQDWMQTTIAAHIAVQGTNAGYESHRQFWNNIQSLPAAPSGFKLWMCYTSQSGMQDLVFWTYNPDTYKPIKVTKTWSDYSNSFGTRPSSITVNLYRNGTYLKNVTLNASNNWSASFGDQLIKSGSTTYSYTVKEASVPAYYSASYSGMTYNSAKDEYQFTATNTLSVGYLKLYKSSSLPDVTDGNGCYSLEGAEYTVYNNKNGNSVSSPAGVLTTEANGQSNTLRLLPKTYYVKETKAPTGYEKDETIYTVKITTNNTTSSPYRLEVEDRPGNDPAGIEITKIWNGPETSTIPTLEGTQFTVNYYDDLTMTEADLESATPTRTWVLEVKYVESIDKYMTALTDTYLVKDLSDEFYRDETGQPILPYGTITIQETKTAADYTFDGYLTDIDGNTVSTDSEIYMTTIDGPTDAVALQGGNEYAGYNTPISGKITLKKFDSDGKNPLEGVTFQCVGETVEDVYTATTDENGEVVFDNLYPDVYTITEIETVPGHTLLSEPLVVEVPMRVTEEYIEEFNVDPDNVIYDEADDIYYINEFTYEITNDVSFEMPMAGGLTDPKVFLPLISGLMILSGVGIVLLRRRRLS